MYVWQRVPKGMSSLEFATLLLQEQVAIVTTPGPWIAQTTADGQNPGEGYVRFALVPSVERTRLAAQRIRSLRF